MFLFPPNQVYVMKMIKKSSNNSKARKNDFITCKSNVTSHMTVLNMEAALISEIDFYQALTKRNFFQDFLILSSSETVVSLSSC